MDQGAWVETTRDWCWDMDWVVSCLKLRVFVNGSWAIYGTEPSMGRDNTLLRSDYRCATVDDAKIAVTAAAKNWVDKRVISNELTKLRHELANARVALDNEQRAHENTRRWLRDAEKRIEDLDNAYTVTAEEGGEIIGELQQENDRLKKELAQNKACAEHGRDFRARVCELLGIIAGSGCGLVGEDRALHKIRDLQRVVVTMSNEVHEDAAVLDKLRTCMDMPKATAQEMATVISRKVQGFDAFMALAKLEQKGLER